MSSLLKRIKEIFKKLKRDPKSKWDYKKVYKQEDPKAYDCRESGWGYSVNIDDSSRFNITEGVDKGTYFKSHGFLTPLPKLGDLIVKRFGKGDMILRIVEIRYAHSDMFFATLGCIDYATEEEVREMCRPKQVSESAKIMLEGRTKESHPEQYYGLGSRKGV